jgi:hypothetical protein
VIIVEPRAITLPAVALAMVVAGVVIPNQDHAVSVALVVVGAGMFFIGALMPTLTEFQVGPTGFSAKLRERDLDFKAVLGPEAEQLMQTGTWLAGGPEAGKDLAERALTEIYLRWPDERAHNPSAAVRQRMVELAPPANPAPASPAQYEQPGGAGDLLSRLIALPVAERSALVLHLLEGLDTNTVASITRREPASVATDIARGAASVVTGAPPPSPGVTW